MSLVVDVQGGEPVRRVGEVVVGPGDAVVARRLHARGDGVGLAGTAGGLAGDDEARVLWKRLRSLRDGVRQRVTDDEQFVGSAELVCELRDNVSVPRRRENDAYRWP